MDRSALVPLVTDDQILDELRPPAIAWHIARRSKLAELRSLMETRFIVSVEGVSGAGKTFLVSGHLQEVRSDPLNVLWHTPITGSGLNDLFLVLEPRLGITTTEDGSRVRGLFRWLRETQSVLVIDDFHRADMISFTPLIQIALAQGGPARLCLISNKRIQGDFHGLPRLLLKGFSSDETNQFFREQSLSVSSDLIRALKHTCGLLPGFLQVFARMLENSVPVDDLEAVREQLQHSEPVQEWAERALTDFNEEEIVLLQHLAFCIVRSIQSWSRG